MTDLTRQHLDCADPTPSSWSLLSRDPDGGLEPLFDGRRVAYSFNTRTALREACDILGLQPGDGVLAPAYNCGSELDPLLDAGLDIAFYRVDRRTCPDLADIARRITPKTKAIYLIHYFGMLQPDTSALRALCDEHGLFLIEDCALSLLSGDNPAEGFAGDVSVFCFYKLFPVLAGGAIVLNANGLNFQRPFDQPPPASLLRKPYIRMGLEAVLGPRTLRKLAMWRRKGRAVSTTFAEPGPHIDMPPGYYFDPALRSSRISGFTKRALETFNPTQTRARRRENYQTYQTLLSDTAGIAPLYATLPETACPLSYPVLVEDRDALAARLSARGIAATPWWSGYNQKLNWDGFDDAKFLKDHVLSLPCGQHLDRGHISLIMSELTAALGTADPN
ncbi:DegT/DnrJ/EryC1/StrS family aminotransferase [Aliiroseovarius sp. F47248L]|uniref:DegT/DnrJ/EryC1/StrS family aminotransferase n=1 Tax=Aliiroseovarius sp. F47248L TaxID=2926420 RepID=UPI001FF24899|nr:DegT/DnrJ/EryC1/StrS family aminotransferase [Aliiroseovarius sp. F47248L]MCK0140616.1 DegT/DnrJ/EryC1/StrS family aminotransferase [Aliiroseovarius sp. F47248L]